MGDIPVGSGSNPSPLLRIWVIFRSVEDDQLERETVEAALTRKVDDDLGDSSTWITSASISKNFIETRTLRLELANESEAFNTGIFTL